jgi:hypothetical protein
MPAIFYSLCSAPSLDDTLVQINQLHMSIQSIRRFNRGLPIYVLNFGVPQPLMALGIDDASVKLIPQPDYRAALSEYCGNRSEALQQYRVHHKWLGLQHFIGCEEESLLYIDSDTVFFSDPSRLFERYSEYEWYAREEPHSSYSHLGIDTRYINEELLRLLARERNAQFIQPMNLGAILLNRRSWEKIVTILPIFFSNIWNLFIWVAQNRSTETQRDQRVKPIIDVVRRLATPSDLMSSIPHPSSNLWIVGEIAMMLALGKLQRFSFGLFSKEHVVQGREFADLQASQWARREALLCHYYSKNYIAFLEAFPQFTPS